MTYSSRPDEQDTLKWWSQKYHNKTKQWLLPGQLNEACINSTPTEEMDPLCDANEWRASQGEFSGVLGVFGGPLSQEPPYLKVVWVQKPGERRETSEKRCDAASGGIY
ncbi:unnamed protein product [Arctogadus glacialis]